MKKCILLMASILLTLFLQANTLATKTTTSIVNLSLADDGHNKFGHPIKGTRISEESVVIEWNTTDDQNIDLYCIQKLTSAGWVEVETIDPTGSGGNYSVTDFNALQEGVTYRLRVTFSNGEISYSDSITVE